MSSIHVSALDSIYSEENALKYAKELVSKNKEEEFLELAPIVMIGSGKTTWYSRVVAALLYLKTEGNKNG